MDEKTTVEDVRICYATTEQKEFPTALMIPIYLHLNVFRVTIRDTEAKGFTISTCGQNLLFVRR